MKLKVKLAKEFSKTWADEGKARFKLLNPAGFDNDAIKIDMGFIAGFEKAIDLLIEKKGKTGWIDEKVSEIRLIGEEKV